MVRAALSLVGIVATVAVLLMLYGYTTPQVTATLPSVNRSVEHTVALMQSVPTEGGRIPAGLQNAEASPMNGAGSAPGSAPAPGAPLLSPPTYPDSTSPSSPRQPAPPGNTAEIIDPDTTAHLNPDHIHAVDQPTPAWASPASTEANAPIVNPSAFVPPNPLPAHPSWTWEVQDHEFNDVVVTHVDADLVTITSDSGPAQIDIALLSPEIQRQLNYNPSLALAAAAARKNAAAASRH